jgi:hypothetical protein
MWTINFEENSILYTSLRNSDREWKIVEPLLRVKDDCGVTAKDNRLFSMGMDQYAPKAPLLALRTAQ